MGQTHGHYDSSSVTKESCLLVDELNVTLLRV